MPFRKTPLVNGEIYHVFNRSTGSIPIFTNKREYERFIFGINYYRHKIIPVKLSLLKILSKEERGKILNDMINKDDLHNDLICYCIMPTHYHFVLKQLHDGGINNFLRLVSNSYSHYYNKKHDRSGSVFGGRFKSVHIETDEQLLHVVRYIHLNPYSSYIVKGFKELESYPYSSLNEYLGNSVFNICQKNLVMDYFKTAERYKKFVFNQAEYQKSLEKIKHLIFK